MKYKLYRVLLTMLGFAACAPQPNPGTTDSTDNPPDTPVENLSGMYGPPMAEYGVPHVNLVINGAVSDPDGTETVRTSQFGDRSRVRQCAVLAALNCLRRRMSIG